MKKSFGKLLLLSSLTTALVACGGGSGKITITTSSSTSSSVSSAISSSVAVSSEISSAAVSSITSSTATSSTSSTTNLSTPLKDLAEFPIGIAVELDGPHSLLSSAKQKEVVAHHFDQLTAGNHMKMSYLQSAQGNFHYTQADQMVAWGEENGLGVHGHALVWHSDYQVPNFMKNFSGTSQAFLDLVDNHARTVASHFAGKVASWDVVNEAFLDSGEYRNQGNEGSIFYQKAGGKDYIAKAFIAAREADSTADLYYNDYNTEQNGAKTDAVIAMAKELLDDGVPITGIGYQMHVMLDWPSIANIKGALKKAADLGLMVKITELDVPINHSWSGTYQNGTVYRTFTPALAQQQKKRYCEIVSAYMEVVPAAQRGGVTIWGVADHQSWLMGLMFSNEPNDIVWPLLFDKDYNEKPALLGVADALQGKSC